MSTAVAELMTLEEFHALPEDPAVDRMLLGGRLVEQPVTIRNRWHAGIEARVVQRLRNWIDLQPDAPGEAYSGEVGCELPEENASVGIDVAFFSRATIQSQPEDALVFTGAPVLSVEILSSREVIGDLHEKVRLYLRAGVKLVWVIDPRFRTVTEYQPDAKPRMYVEGDVINGDPHLPGLTIEVTSLFE